jgi:hypothetical protein
MESHSDIPVLKEAKAEYAKRSSPRSINDATTEMIC